MLRLARIAKSQQSSRFAAGGATILGAGSVILLSSHFSESYETSNNVTYAEKAPPTQDFATVKRSDVIPTRQEQIDTLSSGKVFDVLVIGGGAT